MLETSKVDYRAGLFRRLAAIVYDSLVVIAILFFASALAMFCVSMALDSTAITEQQILVENPIYFSWLIFCWFYYYAWCWRKGGQTLGMKAWRLKLVSCSGQTISYKNSAIRFFSALLGIANFGVLLPVKRGWHDILSNSNIIVIDKNS